MIDTHPIDWRFYFRPGPWDSVRFGPDLPASTTAALRTLAPDSAVLEPGGAWVPPVPDPDRTLVVLARTDVQAMEPRAFARMSADTCLVVVNPPPRPRDDRVFGATDPATAHTLSLKRIPLAGRRAVHYPAGNARARRLVWETVARPVSLRGKMARLGAISSEISPIMLLRGETIQIHCPPNRLLPVAPELVVLSTGMTESDGKIAYFHLSAYGPAARKTNPAILILAGSGTGPATLVKVPRSSERQRTLAAEVRKLARFSKLQPGTHPRPLPIPDGVEWPGTAQTFVAGQMLSGYSAAERPGIVYRTASALFDLDAASLRATRAGELRPPDPRRFLGSLVSVAIRHELLPTEHREEMGKLLDALLHTPWKLVLCHRDAGAWNIVVRDGRHPHLVDWESAAWGLPGEDLIYLLLFLVYQETGALAAGERVEAFRTRFVEPSGRPTWLRETLLRLSRHLRMEGSTLQALVAMVLLRHAHDQCILTRFAAKKDALAEPFSTLLTAVIEGGADPWSARRLAATYARSSRTGSTPTGR
ncbi:MAG: aminoglycoside phosphotransferase family protein [Thermoleophilia bacterium]